MYTRDDLPLCAKSKTCFVCAPQYVLIHFLKKVPVDTRLDKFKEKAVPLVSDVARRAIKEAGIDVSDVSKLVVVSSTGFLGPGLDCELIKNLGLTRSVDRTLIGFMGCAAAMNGFRNANDFVTVSFLMRKKAGVTMHLFSIFRRLPLG